MKETHTFELNLNPKKKQVNKTNTKSTKKQQELNFKKWLLSLSSIGNLILGGLLVVMGIQ